MFICCCVTSDLSERHPAREETRRPYYTGLKGPTNENKGLEGPTSEDMRLEDPTNEDMGSLDILWDSILFSFFWVRDHLFLKKVEGQETKDKSRYCPMRIIWGKSIWAKGLARKERQMVAKLRIWPALVFLTHAGRVLSASSLTFWDRPPPCLYSYGDIICLYFEPHFRPLVGSSPKESEPLLLTTQLIMLVPHIPTISWPGVITHLFLLPDSISHVTTLRPCFPGMLSSTKSCGINWKFKNM